MGGDYSSFQEPLEGIAKSWQQDRGTGLAVCVRDAHGDVVFNEAYGPSDRDTQKDLQKDALCCIGSQSKIVTATAIHQLVQDKKIHPRTGRPLSLMDNVTDLLPKLQGTEWLQGITLEDMLCHRTRFGNGPVQCARQPPTFEDLRNLSEDRIGMPSENSGYSNRAYNMLGVIIEDASGMTFSQYIGKEIVERHQLGEIYSGYEAVPDSEKHRIPTGYSGENLDKPFDPVSVGALTPSGGFLATAEAFSDFFYKLARGQILSGHFVTEDSSAGMFEPKNKGSGQVGLGVLITPLSKMDLLGNPNPYHVPGMEGFCYGHQGSLDDGFDGNTRYYPQAGCTVTVLDTGYNGAQSPKLLAKIVPAIVEHQAPSPNRPGRLPANTRRIVPTYNADR